MSEGSKAAAASTIKVNSNHGKQGDTQNRSEKTNDIRTTNIQAAKGKICSYFLFGEILPKMIDGLIDYLFLYSRR